MMMKILKDGMRGAVTLAMAAAVALGVYGLSKMSVGLAVSFGVVATGIAAALLVGTRR
jgi:Asp/Glu/hydantoin racemase